MTEIPEGFISISEARALSNNVSRQNVHQRVNRFQIPKIKVGHYAYIDKSEYIKSIVNAKLGRPRKQSLLHDVKK